MSLAIEKSVSNTVVWLTPPYILEALGEFDLDPCACDDRPWDTAAKHYTKKDDGLSQPWEGRVWMNPPYGKGMNLWLEKLAEHGDGIALIFARTETNAFFDYVWDKADAVYFLKGRLKFYTPEGIQGGTAAAPSVLVAYGQQNVDILKSCPLPGRLVMLKD